MSGDLQTQLDRPYSQQPETRAAATRYLTRTGNADLLAMLGLVDAPPAEPQHLACGHKRHVDGRSACRYESCPAGPKSRQRKTKAGAP